MPPKSAVFLAYDYLSYYRRTMFVCRRVGLDDGLHREDLGGEGLLRLPNLHVCVMSRPREVEEDMVVSTIE